MRLYIRGAWRSYGSGGDDDRRLNNATGIAHRDPPNGGREGLIRRPIEPAPNHESTSFDNSASAERSPDTNCVMLVTKNDQRLFSFYRGFAKCSFTKPCSDGHVIELLDGQSLVFVNDSAEFATSLHDMVRVDSHQSAGHTTNSSRITPVHICCPSIEVLLTYYQKQRSANIIPRRIDSWGSRFSLVYDDPEGREVTLWAGSPRPKAAADCDITTGVISEKQEKMADSLDKVGEFKPNESSLMQHHSLR